MPDDLDGLQRSVEEMLRTLGDDYAAGAPQLAGLRALRDLIGYLLSRLDPVTRIERVIVNPRDPVTTATRAALSTRTTDAN